MNLFNWELIIKEAYENRDRTRLGLAANLQCEAAEVAELMVKFDWYGKTYDIDHLVSEAGDVLNFLTAILQSHNRTLEDALENNESKLRSRGWIK